MPADFSPPGPRPKGGKVARGPRGVQKESRTEQADPGQGQGQAAGNIVTRCVKIIDFL